MLTTRRILKNPYRTKTTDPTNLSSDEIEYLHGYLRSLYQALDFLNTTSLRRFLILKSKLDTYKSVHSPYFKGFNAGLEDAYEQFKVIPKHKLYEYVAELYKELKDFEKEHYDLD